MNNHVDHCEVCQTTEGVREICSDGTSGTPKAGDFPIGREHKD